MSGLSVEQRKRLTIAVELVANPSIIFMDEPTSGLDARAAAIIMRAVRNIVNTGRTIVCTIHQPSIDIFESFDELLLLKVRSTRQSLSPSFVSLLSPRSSHPYAAAYAPGKQSMIKRIPKSLTLTFGFQGFALQQCVCPNLESCLADS